MAKHDDQQRAATEAVRRVASRALPGRRQALPQGALTSPNQRVQGDEHRDPDRPVAPPPPSDPGTVQQAQGRRPPKHGG